MTIEQKIVREKHFDSEYAKIFDSVATKKSDEVSLCDLFKELYISPGFFKSKIAPKISKEVVQEISSMYKDIETLKSYVSIDDKLVASLDSIVDSGIVEIISLDEEQKKLEKGKYSLIDSEGGFVVDRLSSSIQSYVDSVKDELVPLFKKKEYIDSRRKEGYFEFFGFGGEYKKKQNNDCLLRGDPPIRLLLLDKISPPGQMKLSPTEYLKTELELYYSGKVLEEICFGEGMSGGFGGRSAVERAREADRKACSEWELQMLDDVISTYFAQQGEGPIMKLTKPQLSGLSNIVSHLEYNQKEFSLSDTYLRKSSHVLDAIKEESILDNKIQYPNNS
ncbi:MAG: hypothetical protein ACQESC_02940 [Nanobdellota archaeon]